MIIRALLPKLKPKTVKEYILVILSSEFPLTIKELKLRIKNNFSESVSYQSIHKELSHLSSDQIVVCENKKYLLSIEWIRQLGLFSDLIISNYTKQKKHSINKLLELKNDGDSISFDFDSFGELDNYFLELLDYFNEFFDPKEKILMHYHHNWWPLLYPFREMSIVSKLKSKIYGICASNTKLDKFCAKFENSIGLKVLITNNSKINWQVNIMGDLVVSFYGDRDVYAKLEDYFVKYKDVSNINYKELIDILQIKGKFRVLVVKDSVLARNILDEIKLFNEK